MNPADEPRWLPLAPWLFLILWSAGYGVAKLALQHTGPMTLLALRFAGAVLVLLPFILWLRPALPGARALRDILIVATFLQLLHFGMAYTGMAIGASAGVMALLIASQPILVVLVTSFVARRPPALRIWVGLILGIIGAAWVIAARGEFSGGALLGAVMGFIAVVGLSIGAVYEKHSRPACHPVLAYAIQYGYASSVAVPVALLTEGMHVVWNGELVAALTYIVLANSLLSMFLLLTMVRFGRMARVTSIMFLVPGVAAVIAWWVIDEVMPITAWPGIIIAAIGVLLVLYDKTLSGKQA